MSQALPTEVSAAPGSLAGGAILAALRHWPLALALYLPNLVMGLILAVPIYLAANAVAPLGQWVSRVVDGDYAAVLIELVVAAQTTDQTGATNPADSLRGMQEPLALALLLLPVAILVQGLVYAFVSGGVLAGLRPGEPGPPFWQACRQWFWDMVRLGILSILIFGLLAAIGGVALFGALVNNDEPWIPGVAVALWLSLLNGFLELARADLVVARHGSVLRALGYAFTLPGRPAILLSAMLLWGLLGLLGAAHVSGSTAAVASIPAINLLPALIVQQIAAFVGAWIKLLRLATAAYLAAAGRPAVAIPQ